MEEEGGFLRVMGLGCIDWLFFWGGEGGFLPALSSCCN